MAITFPASPSDGDVFTNTTTGVKYIYNATDGVWKTHVWPTNTDYLQLSGGTLTGNLSLGTNDLTAQDITTTGAVSVGTGLTVGNGLTVSDGNIVMAAGHGIDFSADANAAGMTSELLDDYEEGTWTPVLGVTDGNSTHTQINQAGFYVKVGRKVTIWGRADISALGANGNGVCSMNGLPFNSRTASLVEGGPAVVYSTGFTTNFVPQSTTLNTASDKLTFRCFGGTDRERFSSTLGSGRYTSSSGVMIQGSYYTD